MKPADFRKVAEIFEEARHRSPDQRAVYLDQRRFAQAEPFVREALESRVEEYGEKHRRTIMFRGNLARCLCGQDRLPEALGEFDRALAAAQEVLRPDDPLYATIRVHHGKCLTALERFAEAEEQLRAGYESLRDVLGPSHERTLLAVEYLANLHDAWDRPDDAAAWRRKLSDASDSAAVSDQPSASLP